jgi:hypothetical protein
MTTAERLESRLHTFVSVKAANVRLAAEAADKAVIHAHTLVLGRLPVQVDLRDVRVLSEVQKRIARSSNSR